MPAWKNRLRKWTFRGTLALFLCADAGCGQKADPVVTPPTESSPAVAAQNKDEPKTETNAGPRSIAAVPVGNDLALYTQSFEDAVIMEVLDGQQQPPDMTIAGKGTAKLREDLEKIWSSIPLTAKGMTIPYVLQIETDEGAIEISLQTHLAPNHVRNIVALTKLGYYDGLRFERLIHQISDDKTQRLDMITAGCPLGTGEEGFGHIAYTMKAQINPDLKHEEGTVGLWRDGEDKNGAGCRFYITLGAAPTLDGYFTIIGKVTKGLDVVKRIAAKPVKGTMEPESSQPMFPVVMKKVTVQPDPLEKSPPVAHNK